MTAVAKTCPPVKYGPLPFTPNKALPQISTHYYTSQKIMMKMTLILKLQVHDAGWQAFFRMTATLTEINSYSNCTELSAFIGSLA